MHVEPAEELLGIKRLASVARDDARQLRSRQRAIAVGVQLLKQLPDRVVVPVGDLRVLFRVRERRWRLVPADPLPGADVARSLDALVSLQGLRSLDASIQ